MLIAPFLLLPCRLEVVLMMTSKSFIPKLIQSIIPLKLEPIRVISIHRTIECFGKAKNTVFSQLQMLVSFFLS